MEILIKRLSEEAKPLNYKSESASGIAILAVDEVTIEPGQVGVVSTGVAIAVPVGYVGIICNNDCCEVERELEVQTAIVNSSYRQEIKIAVRNQSDQTQTIAAGDKVAEMLVHEVQRPRLIEVEELS